jgi:hypothetical protein
MKTYKVIYSGNSRKYANFEQSVSANSEREAVVKVYSSLRNNNYFPQEDGSIQDLDGDVIASPESASIDFDGGCFSAELL